MSQLKALKLILTVSDIDQNIANKSYVNMPQGSPKGGAVRPTHHRGPTACPAGHKQQKAKKNKLKQMKQIKNISYLRFFNFFGTGGRIFMSG